MSKKRSGQYIRADLSLNDRWKTLNWWFFGLVTLIACAGFMALYSASGGNPDVWLYKQMTRFAVGFIIMLTVALADIRLVLKFSYAAYITAFLLLIAVALVGTTGMGAQRWLNLGLFNLQPSELMKPALVLALARYYNGLSMDEIRSTKFLAMPLILLAVPVFLILRQPDLGGALLLILSTGVILLLSGVQWWKFAAVGAAGLACAPVIWHFLRDYQKRRVLVFFNPELDRLGSGYHVIQSKITMGSGGFWGRGFGQGTQSQLNFLPEKHTDFIFTVWAEDFGMIGSVGLFALYLLLLWYSMNVALKSTSFFSKILAMGLTVQIAIYVFFNILMVMGLAPVTGIALPLVSYGGTSMVVMMATCGLIECINVNRNQPLSRSSVR